MSVVLSTLLPLFLVIALGAALARGGFFQAGVTAGLNRLIFWVGLPALIFGSLSTAERSDSRPGLLLVAMLVATLLTALAAWGLAALIRLPRLSHGTFVQAVFRGNLAFVGLPVILSLPGLPLTPALLVIAPMMIVYNLLAVVALVASRRGLRLSALGSVFGEVAKNPLILSSLAGGLAYLFGWRLWPPLETAVIQVGRMAVPLALLVIGSALVTLPLRGNIRLAAFAAAGKTVLSPLLGLGVGLALGLPQDALFTLVILMACPTAAISYSMTCQLGGDEALAAGGIVASTIASALALGTILLLLPA